MKRAPYLQGTILAVILLANSAGSGSTLTLPPMGLKAITDSSEHSTIIPAHTTRSQGFWDACP
jgi:hypothetical protein